MSQKLSSAIAVIGIDIGKNSFHMVGHNQRGAIVLRQKWSRGQVEARLANLPAESEAKRPPIPTEGGHRFRSKAATRSERRRSPC